MAEVALAASIIGVAATGISVAETLITFASSYQGAGDKINEIVDGLSVTSSTLRRLGRIIENHTEHEKGHNADLTRAVSGCKETNNKVKSALHVAEEVSGQSVAAKDDEKMRMMRRWEKFKWALGKEEGIDALLNPLARSKSNIELLINVLNYGILLDIAKSGSEMKPQMLQDFDDLKRQMKLITTQLGLFQIGPSVKEKPPADRSRGVDKTVPRQDPQTESDRADPPTELPVSTSYQVASPYLQDRNGVDDGENLEDQKPRNQTNSPDRPSLHVSPAHPHHPLPSPSPSSSSSSTSAEYAYEAWMIRTKIRKIVSFEEERIVEQIRAGKPELAKIARKQGSASNLVKLIDLHSGARDELNKIIDRPRLDEPTLVLIEPLKKWWRLFFPHHRKSSKTLLIIRVRETGDNDVRYERIVERERSPDEIQIVRRERHESIERILPPPPPRGPWEPSRTDPIDVGSVHSPTSEKITLAPEQQLPSQEEAEDLIAKYLASFTASHTVEGHGHVEEDQVDAKQG